MADENYWTYKAVSPTLNWVDAVWVGAIKSDSKPEDWYKLSPGMRREIVRAKTKNNLK